MSHHQHDERQQDQPASQPGPDEQTPAAQEPRDYQDPVDEAVDDSFPASDPPSWGGSTATVDPE